MEKIYVTRNDYVEYGKDCDGYYYIALFFRNLAEKWNGRTFLTYSLFKAASSNFKKCLKNYKGKEDDLFLNDADCQEIYRLFDKLEKE